MAVCSVCSESFFGGSHNAKYCPSCKKGAKEKLAAARRKRWQQNNKLADVKCYTRNNWRNSGIKFKDEEEFEYWFNRYVTQEKCDVTGLPLPPVASGRGEYGGKALNQMQRRCLDHDHNTGRPRGVILGWVNLVIGKAETYYEYAPDFFREAIEYLKDDEDAAI